MTKQMMKKRWRDSILFACSIAAFSTGMTGSDAVAQNTAKKSVTEPQKIEMGAEMSNLPAIPPQAVVIVQEDPDRYKELLADYNSVRRNAKENSLRNQLQAISQDQSLQDWERSNKASRTYRPYQPIEVDVLEGERDMLGLAYVKYRLKGVVSKRTIAGPPGKSGKYMTQTEEVYWSWNVPFSLQGDLARDAVNGGLGKTREVMAIWFCPENWSLQNRESPTLCYFAEKGLVWRKRIPLKETLADLPEPEVFRYTVNPDRETVLVSDDGKYVWVNVSVRADDRMSKRTVRSTFIFIYSDKGELRKTVHFPDTVRTDSGNAMVLNGKAFVLTLVTVQQQKETVRNMIFQPDGIPIYRFVDNKGQGIGDLRISRDGGRALALKPYDENGKREVSFYNLDNLARSVPE